jgi:uncharacterized membrane protein
MRSVHSEAEDRVRFVPVISVSVAVALALFAIGMLIYQIDHVAKSIQAAVIVDRATTETLAVIRSVAADSCDDTVVPPLPMPTAEGAWVAAESGGYVESVDDDSLLEWASRNRATVVVAPTVGTFVAPRLPIVGVWPARELSEDDEAHLRRSLVLARERSLRADPAFGLRQVSDIALRAISPGINDPTTATMCIDRLGEMLIIAALEGGPFGERSRVHGEGRVQVRGQSYEQLVEVAFARSATTVPLTPRS